jgi:hypothetical protein
LTLFAFFSEDNFCKDILPVELLLFDTTGEQKTDKNFPVEEEELLVFVTEDEVVEELPRLLDLWADRVVMTFLFIFSKD